MHARHVIEAAQVNISGLYLVLRLADRNHIADDVPHSIVSHIVAELQVHIPHHCSRAAARPPDAISECNSGAASDFDATGTQLQHCFISPALRSFPPKLVRDSGRSNNGWTQWCARSSRSPCHAPNHPQVHRTSDQQRRNMRDRHTLPARVRRCRFSH